MFMIHHRKKNSQTVLSCLLDGAWSFLRSYPVCS